MNLFVGLVIRSQFQEVLSKKNGGKIGLFHLSLITNNSKKHNEMDENVILFKVWGNHGKDKLRHRICRGSIVVIEEIERKRFSNEKIAVSDSSDVLIGNILAFTELNSNEVIIYDSHPSICSDIVVRYHINSLVSKFNTVISRHMQWSILRSCFVKSHYKVDFHSILSDTKAVLYTIPLKLFISPLLSRTTCTSDIYVMDSDGICVKFYFSNSKSRQLFTSQIREVLESNQLFPVLSNFLTDIYQDEPHMSAELCLSILEDALQSVSKDSHNILFKEQNLSPSKQNEVGSITLSLLFENIAIYSSYQHQISSLRFLPHHSKIKLHFHHTGNTPVKKQIPPSMNHFPPNTHLSLPINETFSTSMYEVPEVLFYTWRQLQELLVSLSKPIYCTSTSASSIRDSEVPDTVPYPEGYILLCAYVHEVHFYGKDKQSFHHNIIFPSGIDADENQCWYYREAVLTLSPTENATDPASTGTTERSTSGTIDKMETALGDILYKQFMSISEVHTTATLAEQISQVILSTQCPFTCYSEPSSHINDEKSPTHLLKVDKPLLRTKDIIYAIIQHHLSRKVVAIDNHHINSLLGQQITADQGIRKFQPSNQDHDNVNSKRKYSESQDVEINNHTIIEKRLFRRSSSSHWRFSAPSLISQETNPMLDNTKKDKSLKPEVNLSERYTGLEQTFFESPNMQLSVFISHEYQLNRLFCGISPQLVALDMYRQENKQQSINSIGDNESCSPIPYFEFCLSRLNKMLSLGSATSMLSHHSSQYQHQHLKPHIFVCRFLPSVDEDCNFTGELTLSLEDIV